MTLGIKRGLSPLLKLRSKLSSKELLSICLGEPELKLAVATSTLPTGRVLSQLLSVDIRDLPEEEVGKKLQATLTGLKVKEPRFIGVVPSHWAITRNIEIPSRDPQEIREIVNLQASRHTPYSRSEIVIDYMSLGVFKSVYTKILLVIVPRTAIARYYDILAPSNLRLDKIVFGPEAIARNLSRRLRLEAEKSPSCIVRIDRTNSDFMIIARGLVLFIRSLPIGAQQFQEEKETQLTRFVDELKQSLETYRSENIDQDPSQLLLTGSASGLESLEPIIQEVLKLPLKRLAEGEGMPIYGDAKPVSASPHTSFLDVVSAPLSFEELTLDLTPEENKLKRTVEERSKEIVKTGILSMVLLGLVCSIFVTQFFFRKAQTSELARRYEPIRKEAKALEDAYTQIQAIRSYLESRGKSIESLAELYNLIPADIYLMDIKFEEEGKFSIKGSSLSRPSIFAFVGTLEESRFFRNVQTKYVTGRKEEGKELSDFEIVASLEK